MMGAYPNALIMTSLSLQLCNTEAVVVSSIPTCGSLTRLEVDKSKPPILLLTNTRNLTSTRGRNVQMLCPQETGDVQKSDSPGVVKTTTVLNLVNRTNHVYTWSLIQSPTNSNLVISNCVQNKKDSTLKYSTSESSNVLTIEDVQPGDAGCYVCSRTKKRTTDTAVLVQRLLQRRAVGEDKKVPMMWNRRSDLYYKADDDSVEDYQHLPSDEHTSFGTCLTVNVPPDITSERSEFSIVEGENTLMECETTGSPKPQVIWLRKDKQHFPAHLSAKTEWGERMESVLMTDKWVGTRLELRNVKRNEMGIFYCIASNSIPPSVSKRFILKVNFVPTIRATENVIGVHINDSVELSCHCEGYPRPMIFWTLQKRRDEWWSGSDNNGCGSYGGCRRRNNVQTVVVNSTEMMEFTITMNSKNKTINTANSLSYNLKSVLQIKKVNSNSFGTYRCVASNSLGTRQDSVRLYELEREESVTGNEFKLKTGKENGVYVPRKRIQERQQRHPLDETIRNVSTDEMNEKRTRLFRNEVVLQKNDAETITVEQAWIRLSVPLFTLSIFRHYILKY